MKTLMPFRWNANDRTDLFLMWLFYYFCQTMKESKHTRIQTDSHLEGIPNFLPSLGGTLKIAVIIT